MIFQVRHKTQYTYENRITSAKLVLRVTPRNDTFQHLIDFSLHIHPNARSRKIETDFFGNTVTIAIIESGLDSLTVEARARVQIQKHNHATFDFHTGWRDVAAQATQLLSVTAASPVHFLFASPCVDLHADVTAYAAQSFHGSVSVASAARDLAVRIQRDFAYRPNISEISTPVATTFTTRQGVCQDFAHLMIAGLRGIGIPAAYVSGYIRTVPAPGQARLEGADATHAWVSVWCGQDAGWLDVDPTNGMTVGDDHIKLAIGRDFSDVSPIHGVFVGSGAQELSVGVDVIAEAS